MLHISIMKALTIAMVLGLSVAGCAGQEMTAEGPDAEEVQEGREAIAEMKQKDPGIQKFVDSAYGYAIFPSVGKGGLIVGATSGDGWVFEKGHLVGKTELTKVSVGAQAGGESFSQVIFFKDAGSMDKFKKGNLELGADVNAVAIKQGASATTGYEKGMAIFVMTKGGAMAEASVGGQTFDYEPIK
ncbi:MAG: lipid-binding SYLF domain-containing protein [Polyangiaceae bacterium]|nr:lipid-binding SYLF domain-containing protein [Polyangiaceae bacterium]